MTTVLDEHLYDNADRAKGAVVLITGGGRGIGRLTAIEFAKRGARIVIGDVNVQTGEQTISEISEAGGQAIFQKCDVTIWDDQVSLFERAISEYGEVDIVVANAGIGETGEFGTVKLVDGRPVKPTFKTMEVNLMAVLQTTHLALHYISLKQESTLPRTVVLIGSMASFQGIPRGPYYSGSKHAVLGVFRAITPFFKDKGIRTAIVCPWFADTEIVQTSVKVILAGIPLVPVSRATGAIVGAACDPDPETDASVWTLPDGGPVFRLPRDGLHHGVYKMLNNRIMLAETFGSNVRYAVATAVDLSRIIGLRGVALFLAVVVGVLVQVLRP